MLTDDFNVDARAMHELALFQSNIIAKLADGSEVRAVFNGVALEDFDFGEPLHSPVVDFWLDTALPAGGFRPERAP